MARKSEGSSLRFTRDASGPGRVIDRRGNKNFYWGGGTQAQPGGRNSSSRATALHPFSPRLRASRQQANRESAAATRKALGIYGPGTSARGR